MMMMLYARPCTYMRRTRTAAQCRTQRRDYALVAWLDSAAPTEYDRRLVCSMHTYYCSPFMLLLVMFEFHVPYHADRPSLIVCGKLKTCHIFLTPIDFNVKICPYARPDFHKLGSHMNPAISLLPFMVFAIEIVCYVQL